MRFKKRLYVAIAFGVIGFIAGSTLTYQNPAGNTSAEISVVEKRLQAIIRDNASKRNARFILSTPIMDDVSEAVKSLTLENQRIGMAKVMMNLRIFYMPLNKLPLNAPAWEDRYAYGNKSWVVQEKYQLIEKSILIGLASFAAVSATTLALAIVLSIIWYFLLERIEERY